MELKTSKLLGSGVHGSVYECKLNGRTYIYKIEKMHPSDSSMYNKLYTNQVLFNTWLLEQPTWVRNHFLTTVEHGIIHGCKYKHKIPKWAAKIPIIDTLLKEANNNDMCFYYIQSPVLDGTFKSLSIQDKKKECKRVFKQLLPVINHIRKHRWIHRDLHEQNLMYKQQATGKKWYIIDCGSIYRYGYSKSNDIKIKKTTIPDIIMFTHLAVSNPFFTFHKARNPNQIKLFMDKALKSVEYTEITKKIPSKIANDQYVLGLIFMCKYPEAWFEFMNIPMKYRTTKYMPIILIPVEDILLMIKHSQDKNFNKMINLLSF